MKKKFTFSCTINIHCGESSFQAFNKNTYKNHNINNIRLPLKTTLPPQQLSIPLFLRGLEQCKKKIKKGVKKFTPFLFNNMSKFNPSSFLLFLD